MNFSDFIVSAIYNNGGFLLIGFGIFLLVVFIVREISCWYWKVNERLEVLHNIEKELIITNKLLRGDGEQAEISSIKHQKDIKANQVSKETTPKA